MHPSPTAPGSDVTTPDFSAPSAKGVFEELPSVVSRGGEQQLRLPATLDMPAAIELRSSLLEFFRNKMPIVIDGGDVQRFSTPCAQILISAARCADLLSIPYHLENISREMISALDDLGMSAIVQKWIR